MERHRLGAGAAAAATLLWPAMCQRVKERRTDCMVSHWMRVKYIKSPASGHLSWCVIAMCFGQTK